MVPVGTNIYGSYVATSLQILVIPPLSEACYSTSKISEAASTRLEVGTRVPVIVADTIVLVVTWIKTWNTHRKALKNNIRTPVATMLLRDGTVYFLGLLSLNILNIVGTSTNVFAYATDFTTPLSSIIITHFSLNLRQVAYGPQSNVDDSHSPSFVQTGHAGQVRSRMSSLRFASFVGNMGEQLNHGSDSDDFDMAWNHDSDAFSNVLTNDAALGARAQDEETVNVAVDIGGAGS